MSQTQFKELTDILQKMTYTALGSLAADVKKKILSKFEAGQKKLIGKFEADILSLKASVASLEDALSKINGTSSGLQALQAVASNDDDDNERDSPEIIEIDQTQHAESSDDDSPTPQPTTTTTVKKTAKGSSNGGKWIKRSFSTPDNTQKVVIKPTKDALLELEIHEIGKEKFVAVSPKKGYGGKFPKEVYIYAMDNDKMTSQPVLTIDQLNNKLKMMAKDGCTLYLHQFDKAQLRAINKIREKNWEDLRASLWKKYNVLFSADYIEENRRSHFRYRPNCHSCNSTRSCEVLDGLITERCALIAKILKIEDDRHAIFKKFKEASEENLKKWFDLVEDRDDSSEDDSDSEIMSYKPPADFKESTPKKRKHVLITEDGASRKKQKMSLREEFIAAGNPGVVFDSLHGKMSEEQLRAIYKF